ncbi:MAG: translation elongation factor [Microbacteriaceae bacterium]|nr:translation elongation factor [Microbacteriaceae bacterium]
MLKLDEKTIRSSLVNASRREANELTLPADFDALDWESLDYLGWRDRKYARRAYAIVPLAEGPVGIMLTQAEASPRSRAQCSWCQDVSLPNDVLFFSARRTGPEGRRGDTVGTLVCADFECSANVRRPPRVAYLGFDVEAARDARIDALRQNTAAFARGLVRAA